MAQVHPSCGRVSVELVLAPVGSLCGDYSLHARSCVCSPDTEALADFEYTLAAEAHASPFRFGPDETPDEPLFSDSLYTSSHLNQLKREPGTVQPPDPSAASFRWQ